MNKTELVLVVQKALGKETSKAAAERSVNAVIEGIKKGIKKDKEVQLIGFGSFKVSKRAARKASTRGRRSRSRFGLPER